MTFPLFFALLASIAGTVVDPSGAAMPDVVVSLHNTSTSVTRKTATDSSGGYSFQAVEEGAYDLQITQPGFKHFSSSVAVRSNGLLKLDITLMLEAQAEALTVTEPAAQVETTNTEMGGLISASKAASIPVNGRSYTDLLALQPGVIPVSSQQPNAVVMSGCTNAPPSGDLNPGNMSVSGQRDCK